MVMIPTWVVAVLLSTLGITFAALIYVIWSVKGMWRR